MMVEAVWPPATVDHAAVMSSLDAAVVSIVTGLAVMAYEHSGAIAVRAAEKHMEATHSTVPVAPEVMIEQLAVAENGKLVVRTATAGTTTEVTVVLPHLILAVTVAAFRFGTE